MAEADVAMVEPVEAVARRARSPTRGDGRGWCVATTHGPATPLS